MTRAPARRERATTLAVGNAGLPVSELAGAQRDAEMAIKPNPGLPDGFTTLGSVLDKTHVYQGAGAALTGPVTLKPDDAESRFLLGVRYSDSGNANRAIAELEKLAVSDPLSLTLV